MKTHSLLHGLLALVLTAAPACAQTGEPVVDLLGISNPIVVQKKTFQLTWSAHPDASLYKQEYLAAGDAFPAYQSMMTVDFMVTDSTVEQAVRTKIHELNNLKRTNPIVQYNVLTQATTGEQLIDCLTDVLFGKGLS